jgi:hypothetical protein
MGLIEAAAGGDRLTALRELRDLVAKSLVSCNSTRDVAALARRLQGILQEIEEIEAGESAAEEDPLDELSQRRSDAANRVRA